MHLKRREELHGHDEERSVNAPCRGGSRQYRSLCQGERDEAERPERSTLPPRHPKRNSVPGGLRVEKNFFSAAHPRAASHGRRCPIRVAPPALPPRASHPGPASPRPRPRVRGPRRGSAPATASVSRGCGRLRRPQLRAQAAACARASPVVSGVGACASGVCRAWYPSEARGASRGLCSSGSPAPSASVRATRGGRRSNHPP